MPRFYKRKCDFCGQLYKGQGKRFCSQRCNNLWRHKNSKWGYKKGNIPWNIGIPRKRKTKSKVSRGVKATWQKKGKDYFTKKGLKKLKNRLRGNTYWKLVKNRPKGKNHWNFKGGITYWKKRIWDSIQYKKWRKAVFERDNYTCQICRARSQKNRKVYLIAHHIKSQKQIIEENNIKTFEDALNCKEYWDINNGIALNYKCHQFVERLYRHDKSKYLSLFSWMQKRSTG